MRSRDEIYADMRETLGVAPSFFKHIPDRSLEHEWEVFKAVQFEEGAIPSKYRELIGLALSAVSKCKYCLYYHDRLARVCGATDAEIEEAMHYAKCSVGWSTYITGMGTDFEQFKREVDQACEHARQQMLAAA